MKSFLEIEVTETVHLVHMTNTPFQLNADLTIILIFPKVKNFYFCKVGIMEDLFIKSKNFCKLCITKSIKQKIFTF